MRANRKAGESSASQPARLPGPHRRAVSVRWGTRDHLPRKAYAAWQRSTAQSEGSHEGEKGDLPRARENRCSAGSASLWRAACSRASEGPRSHGLTRPDDATPCRRELNSGICTAWETLRVSCTRLAVTLDAVAQGYDLWGRLVIALVSVMSGGILRDLVLARNRLPFTFLEDPTVPVAITCVVIAYSLLLIGWPDAGRTRTWITIRRYAEAVGFAIVTVYGALACILAGTKWYWAPFGAAMTIAGGGIIRDIIVNREPRNFRGAIFEEIGVISGLLVVVGLIIANQFEHSAWVVHTVLALTVVIITVVRLLVLKYDLRYPRWLAQPAPSAQG